MNRKDEIEQELNEIEEAEKREQRNVNIAFWILTTILTIHLIIQFYITN